MGKRIVEFDVPTLHRLWAAGLPSREICAALGIRYGSFYIVKSRYKLPPRERATPTTARADDDPTPLEIRERAAAVRAAWSPAEEARRRGAGNTRVRLRAYRFERENYVATALD